MSMIDFFTQSAQPEEIPASGPLAIKPVVVDSLTVA
jgi:hypothetical protein